MSTPRYVWRQLTPKQRAELLAWRKDRCYPWHSPPHRPNFGHLRFLISAACFEHQHYIGYSLERMDTFSRDLLAALAIQASQTFAWCVLPNHYHALVEAPELKQCFENWGNYMGEHRTHGTVRRTLVDAKFSFAASNEPCGRTDITGQH